MKHPNADTTPIFRHTAPLTASTFRSVAVLKPGPKPGLTNATRIQARQRSGEEPSSRVAHQMPATSSGNEVLPLVSVSTRDACSRRVLDMSVAVVVLVLGIPVWLLCAVAIWLSDPGPILFKQRRVGIHGRLFVMYKFRSMRQGAEKKQRTVTNRHGAGAVTFKCHNDPRIFAIGRLLRKLSLDEFPQLWNVIRGDMALVDRDLPW